MFHQEKPRFAQVHVTIVIYLSPNTIGYKNWQISFFPRSSVQFLFADNNQLFRLIPCSLAKEGNKFQKEITNVHEESQLRNTHTHTHTNKSVLTDMYYIRR